MANATTEITLLDGDRNVVILANGVLDTSNVTTRTLIDPALLAPIATGLRIDKVSYSMSVQLSCQLLWDATADVVALTLNGFGHFRFKPSSGLLQPTPLGAGSNGKLLLTTTGWASGIQSYSILLECIKLGV